ncbi:MAG: sigma-70 family RNA polymerase sigma factor [Pseudonocardiaceae bacterium]
MSLPHGVEFAEFFRQERPKLVNCLRGRGLSPCDAEDVAQTAFLAVSTRWSAVDKPRAYLYRAAKHEATAFLRRGRCHLDPEAGHVERSAEDTYHQGDVSIVRDSLIILPPAQREVVARYYDDRRTSEIAEALGTTTATVRSNLRFGRTTLRPFLHGDGHRLHRRAGQRLYEAFQRGDPLPVLPRPVILRGWEEAKAHRVDPERGTEVAPLGDDEVWRRRRTSLLAACPWVLDALAELGRSTETMMVVVDADGVVLYRAGDRRLLRLADRIHFVDGAYWDIKNAGANGIALALLTGRAVTVCGWEHYVQAQHGLSCVAAPICDPQGRPLLVVNLTGTHPTISPALCREIDTLTTRVRAQLRALRFPSSTAGLAEPN